MMACIKTQHEAKEKKVLFYIVILSLVLVWVVSCLNLLFSGSAVVWFKESPAEAKKTLIIINHKCKKEKRKKKERKKEQNNETLKGNKVKEGASRTTSQLWFRGVRRWRSFTDISVWLFFRYLLLSAIISLSFLMHVLLKKLPSFE